MFERFAFIKVTGCSPVFHWKRVPSQLFFNKASSNSYIRFVISRVANFQNLKTSKARIINLVSVKACWRFKNTRSGIWRLQRIPVKKSTEK